MYRILKALLLIIVWVASFSVQAQVGGIKWSKDGNAYYRVEENEIIEYTLPAGEKKVLISRQQLTPSGQTEPIEIDMFAFSADQNKLLIYTNATPVWRINTKGEYWVLTLSDNSLKQLGSTRPKSSGATHQREMLLLSAAKKMPRGWM